MRSKGKVFTLQTVLLDFGTQPLMVGKSSIKGSGLHKYMLEVRFFTIKTSMSGSKKATTIIVQGLLVRFNSNNVNNAMLIKARAIFIHVESLRCFSRYNGLVSYGMKH
jgi:hypothetical protein